MGDGFAFLDIIFFALVAGFLILRLRSVLGRRTGNEDPSRWRPPVPTRPSAEVPAEARDNVLRMPGAASPAPAAPAGTPLDAGLTQIKVADPAFDPKGFVEGARAAFEMIVRAFAESDTASLRPLLSDDVFERFSDAIRQRQAAKQTHETTLVGIRSADILEARMDGRNAVVVVKFVSDQINVTRDADGKPVDGDPAHTATITDVWTFSRNTRARDPNWALVATDAQQ